MISKYMKFSSLLVSLSIFSILIMIVDSTIVSIYLNLPKEPHPIINLYLFAGLITSFIILNLFFLSHIFKVYSAFTSTYAKIKYIIQVVSINQTFTCIILVILLFQIIYSRFNDITLMAILIFSSNILSTSLLIILTYKFIMWFNDRKSIITILYCISFAFVISSSLLSTIYLGNNVMNYDSNPVFTSVKTQISGYTNYGTNLFIVIELYNYFSLLSFVTLWIPSVYLFKSYSSRFGKIKFVLISFFSILYFVLPFMASQLHLFEYLLYQYDTQFNIIYYLFFSPYKQIGGLLFGLIFLFLSKKIYRENLQNVVRMAGIGIILFFGSQVIYGLTYVISPPFGLVTVSFQSLASCMILIGILSSVKALSIDSTIRRELYKTGKEFEFLNNISNAELQRSLNNTVSNIVKEAKIDDLPSGINLDFNNEDYIQYTREIMDEIQKLRGKR